MVVILERVRLDVKILLQEEYKHVKDDVILVIMQNQFVIIQKEKLMMPTRGWTFLIHIPEISSAVAVVTR